jgi:hypothetical protein
MAVTPSKLLLATNDLRVNADEASAVVTLLRALFARGGEEGDTHAEAAQRLLAWLQLWGPCLTAYVDSMSTFQAGVKAARDHHDHGEGLSLASVWKAMPKALRKAMYEPPPQPKRCPVAATHATCA